MATKIICPDCGGVLGEAGEGEAVCTCFSEPLQANHASSTQTLGGLDLANETTGGTSLSDTQPVEVVTKVCFKCGTDVRGHRRFKDSRGYLCAECNAREVATEKEGTTTCPECSRRVRETALTEFRGRRICKLCVNELRENDKKRVKVISTKNFANEDRRKLLVMIAVLVVLGLLMLISAWRVIHGRV